MARKVWTAEVLATLSSAEQDAIFESSIVTDLDQVPDTFLERVRARLVARIAGTEHRDTP